MKHTDLVAFMRTARLTVDDETALTGKELYPVWAENISVSVRDYPTDMGRTLSAGR